MLFFFSSFFSDGSGAAEALARAADRLRPLGYGLLVHDGYRPWAITWAFWEATPEPLHWLVGWLVGGPERRRG